MYHARRLSLPLALAALMLLSSAALAVDLEWGLGGSARDLDPTYENLNWGFRDVAWGSEKDEIGEKYTLDMCTEVGPKMENCNVADANRSLGDIPLQHVRFFFYDEIFFGVSLKYEPAYEQDVLKKVVELLGEPTGERDNFPIWDLPRISVWASDTHFSLRSKTVFGQPEKSGGTF